MHSFSQCCYTVVHSDTHNATGSRVNTLLLMVNAPSHV